MKTRTKWLLAVAGLIAAVIIPFVISPKKSTGDPNREDWNKSVEGKLLKIASTTRVHPDFRPVLIYRYKGENKRPAFTSVGTEFIGKNGPIVATVAHLLQKQFAGDLFILRYLSPDEHKIELGVEKIAYRNTEAKLPATVDAVFLTPGVAKPLECTNDKGNDVPIQHTLHYYEPVIVDGKAIRKLKSLVSGTGYPVIGAANNPSRILIRYHPLKGESGTGFVDEYGQFYILSCSTEDGNEVTILFGPYANIKKHL